MLRKKIVVLAQTPPPFHGQAVMQNHLVSVSWSWCEKKHIRLNFSESINEVGVPTFMKFYRLLRIVYAVFAERLQGPIDILFYPPCGPHRIPFLRDMAILLLLRPLSRKLVLQFHAGGFDCLQQILTPPELWLARKAYAHADAALVLLPSLAGEVHWIAPRRVFVVPNGIDDSSRCVKATKAHSPPVILFVGTLSVKKGILDAIEACGTLRDNGIPFLFRAVGPFVSESTKVISRERLRHLGLESNFEFAGQKSGEEKWDEFQSASIFCFPSYETENLPVVLLEAMQFQLPIVATRWRAIPDVITEGENGFLVGVQKPDELASKLQLLLNDPTLRTRMGKQGRDRFLNQYSLSGHLKALEDAFKNVAASA